MLLMIFYYKFGHSTVLRRYCECISTVDSRIIRTRKLFDPINSKLQALCGNSSVAKNLQKKIKYFYLKKLAF